MLLENEEMEARSRVRGLEVSVIVTLQGVFKGVTQERWEKT